MERCATIFANGSAERRFPWWVLGVLGWLFPSPIPPTWPTDLVAVASQVLPDATVTVSAVPRCAHESQMAAAHLACPWSQDGATIQRVVRGQIPGQRPDRGRTEKLDTTWG